jgi:hypothetical protein
MVREVLLIRLHHPSKLTFSGRSIFARFFSQSRRIIQSGEFLTIAIRMKLAIRLALLLCLGLLLGCSSTPPLFLGGNWVFTITPSNSSSGAFQATAELTQLRNSIFGPVTFTGNGSSCSAPAMISGTVNGDQLSVQLTQSQSTLKLTGVVAGGPPVAYNASGKYTATTGDCLQSGGAGTWSGFLSAKSSDSSTSAMQ